MVDMTLDTIHTTGNKLISVSSRCLLYANLMIIYIFYKMWNDTFYPFPNFNGAM